ncbi:hypothetical protein C8Q77DRAFT_326064 [Trametes polyzona]|nr:hypothetical protein C8Q77DRAFT_326064 [Trametes polyzona]
MRYSSSTRSSREPRGPTKVGPETLRRVLNRRLLDFPISAFGRACSTREFAWCRRLAFLLRVLGSRACKLAAPWRLELILRLVDRWPRVSIADGILQQLEDILVRAQLLGNGMVALLLNGILLAFTMLEGVLLPSPGLSRFRRGFLRVVVIVLLRCARIGWSECENQSSGGHARSSLYVEQDRPSSHAFALEQSAADLAGLERVGVVEVHVNEVGNSMAVVGEITYGVIEEDVEERLELVFDRDLFGGIIKRRRGHELPGTLYAYQPETSGERTCGLREGRRVSLEAALYYPSSPIAPSR